MNTDAVVYPPAPQHVDERVIRPSAEFRRQVRKVLGAIFFFIAVYIALVAGAIVLAAVCGLAGYALISIYPHFFTIMIGVGLIGLGLMVIFFLLKFMFTWTKPDRSHLMQVTEADQPELFAFVRKLTEETQSAFPKKIYLSSDVNASVFYDSSFWSMFFPIRKNLQIGLGLVNVVNLSEFKAILAHEFGHFSQRSMKLGSYVYNVNHVIYNMLYDNSGYENTLVRWASISSYFAFFANIVGWIVSGIQDILQGVYRIVNKRHMGLSREMEFHADTIAAYVSGGSHLIKSLRRLTVADICYNRLMSHYNDWFGQGLKADNLFLQHTEVIHHYASDYDLPMAHGLPQVSAGSFGRFNKSRVVVKDQWASHPSTDDREASLHRLGIHTDPIHLPAWTVFRNAESLQQKVTDMVYQNVEFKTSPTTLDLELFRQRYWQHVAKYEMPKVYKGFYDSRNLSTVDVDTVEQDTDIATAESLQDILTEESLELPVRMQSLRADIDTLDQIKAQTLAVETFDFEGTKYSWSNAGIFLPNLKKELSQVEAHLAMTDKRVAKFFLQRATAAGSKESLKDHYRRMERAKKELEDDYKNFADLSNILTSLFQAHISVADAQITTNQLIRSENVIKERIQTFLSDSTYSPVIDAEDRSKLTLYTSKQLTYFWKDSFLSHEIQLFQEALHLYHYVSVQYNFYVTKNLLVEQASLLQD